MTLLNKKAENKRPYSKGFLQNAKRVTWQMFYAAGTPGSAEAKRKELKLEFS